MAKRMLIDATHPEETRVVVISGKRLEEFDFETASKKQLKGNIYLAKVTRVEPSLQAAFVEYGGNRHGFLAFNEIHPDYYRIPVADRQALLAEEAAYGRRGGDDEDADLDDGDSEGDRRRRRQPRRERGRAAPEAPTAAAEAEPHAEDDADEPAGSPGDGAGGPDEGGDDCVSVAEAGESGADEHGVEESRLDDGRAMALTVSLDQIASPVLPAEPASEPAAEAAALPADDDAPAEAAIEPEAAGDPAAANGDVPAGGGAAVSEAPAVDVAVETVGGDETEEVEPRRPRINRRYKIQEVIKRRQIMLVQVTKEERGNKGAALTTYLSLAGRYCVLMPNTARGGGVSRKITSAPDRKRLKVIIEDLEIPQGMAVIVRTAGSERNKTEIKRDYEYLLRLWDEIRELTLRSVAPALVYEEANLIKRSIRDLYSRDIDDITVEGEEGYKLAKAFMRMLTPSHAKRVQAYRDPAVPLFQRHQVESQLDAIHNPVVHLKSGGYIVINSTEALVAIDVNSGRSTRERNIEETALRTNLEASDEVARQLRLRDLAGLIVIDYIDMEESRHNAMVERRLKEAMRHDRARIQLGRISHFGLLELSRQRLRPSLFESSMEVCRHCHGTGHIRSVESTALHVLRSIEEEGMRHRSAAITVAVPTAVALYIFNQKRFALGEIEVRHSFRIYLTGDDTLIPPEMRVERIKALEPGELPRQPVSAPLVIEEEPEEPVAEESEAEAESEAEPEAVATEGPAPSEENGRGRRRSRRRGRRDGDRRDGDRRDGDRRPPPPRAPEPAEPLDAVAAEPGLGAVEDNDDGEGPEAPPPGGGQPGDGDRERRRRRRGKRGGRRRSRRPGEPGAPEESAGIASAADNGTGEQPEYDYGAVYDDDTPPSPQPAEVSPASHADAPAEVDRLPAAEPLPPPPPETVRQPEEEPTAAPAAPSVEHREVNGAATIEAAPTPVEPPPAEPAAPPEPTRRGWWKRLVE